jgi:hypothetical protein
MAKREREAAKTVPGAQPASLRTSSAKETYKVSMQSELQKFGREDAPMRTFCSCRLAGYRSFLP